MKVLTSFVLGMSLLLVGYYSGIYRSSLDNHGCTGGACVACKCPCTEKNNVLRWVKDPVGGELLYGWYEEDGSAFNFVATNQNLRMSVNAKSNNVPAYRWVRVQ